MAAQENDPSGVVYILTNEAMPGYVKIGFTKGDSEADVKERMRQLDTTGVPLPFDCVYAAVVSDVRKVERRMHTVFEKDRRRPNREFFEGIPVHSAIAALELAEGRNVTPGTPPEEDAEGQEVLVRPSKRPALTFPMVKILIGAELTFLRDESKTCIVEDDRQVRYQDKVTTLSPLTRELLGYARSPAGADYWVYDGETLSERRRRLESEEAESSQP